MIDSSTGEANTHMYWTGFTLITCKNSIAGPIVNTQSVVVLVWIILGVSIKPGLCYDIPESLYGRTVYCTAIYRYIVTPLSETTLLVFPRGGSIFVIHYNMSMNIQRFFSAKKIENFIQKIDIHVFNILFKTLVVCTC